MGRLSSMWRRVAHYAVKFLSQVPWSQEQSVPAEPRAVRRRRLAPVDQGGTHFISTKAGSASELLLLQDPRKLVLWRRRIGRRIETPNTPMATSTVDDILVHLGPWHYPVLVFCFFRGFPAAYYAMSLSFTAPSLRHWCARPPQLRNWTSQQWHSEAVPPTEGMVIVPITDRSGPRTCQ
ncbi:hypothetical protein MRX96_024010 [Rhipicephalus microplus]